MEDPMGTQKVVYFNEYNVLMDRATYLPLVSGILRACAESVPVVREAYSFKPFIFHLDSPENIVARYDQVPDVAAFSICMWNEQLSLHVARRIKERWPHCLIVFGGPQLPHEPRAYFEANPFIDVGVRAEGEEAFCGLLERLLTSRDLAGIPNVSYRHPENGAFVFNPETPQFDRALDHYPSPYLEGLFDYMFDAHPEVEFQAIIETNRGCPFLCTFCYWGRGGTTRKYRYHELERVKGEIEWCGSHRIRYVFNADSNFGMHKRDPEIADIIVETKKAYGFPEKFRTCWGKNTDENIFRIAGKLHAHDLEKGVTLARQSNSKVVLANIKRGNIKLETYGNLQRLFNDLDVPIYSEMILGLPGETYDSWRDGIDELLKAGLKNQLFVYQCEVYPNTEMGDPDYQRRFGIRTKRIALREIHGRIRDEAWITEYQDIIVETDSMPNADWRRMTRLSVMMMLLHSMKVGFYLLGYLTDRFGVRNVDFIEFISDLRMSPEKGSLFRAEVAAIDSYLDSLMAGHGRGVEMRRYGNIYWDLEEACFLRLSERWDELYAELEALALEFLASRGLRHDPAEVAEVIRYQRMRMPDALAAGPREWIFSFNLPEYFDHRFGTNPISVAAEEQVLEIQPRQFEGDLRRFAKETILWGRKSGTMLVPCDWHSLGRPWVSSRTPSVNMAERDHPVLPRAANLGDD